MRPTRKCEFCGKTFVPRSGMQKYCSEECQAEAKRLRKKRQQDLINGIELIMDLQHQEYLTFSKAAILMGCTRQYIYKLVANGKLKASRLSSRMAFVRKADIEKMFEGNPYKRVVPVSKSKLSKKAKTEKPTQNQEPIKGKEENEVLDYYSGEEVMSLYKVKKSWLYTSAKRNQIPMCRIAGKNYYSKRHIDEFFGTAVDIHSITEWVTADNVEDAFSMSKSALRAYTYRHKIPTKRESMARQNRYIGVLDKFIHEGHEALSSFAKTDRVNFNEKESKEYIAASQHIFAVSHKEALCIKTNDCTFAA